MGLAALWYFDETKSNVRPSELLANVGDLDTEAGLVMPTLVDGVTGKARLFAPAASNGFRAQDAILGSTLLQRDLSIQAIMSWDLAGQNAAGTVGTLYARGKGTGAAEYMCAGLELRVVNVASGIGELRWIWHDAAGVLKTQIGGQFVAQAGFVLLTATRHWLDSTHVQLRYYIGDALMADIVTADGSIGGGTTGTTSIGARWTGAAWANFLAGSVDQMRIVDYELCAEEVAFTHRRLTFYQERGYQLVRECHPIGFPISDDPGSRVQRETRLWGHGLGFAMAQADNIRENILPDRAYGAVLARWEAMTSKPPLAADDLASRRARVVGSIKARAGVSIPGLSTAIREMIAADPSLLQFLAFDQGWVDQLTTLAAERWITDPAAQWTAGVGGLRGQAAAAGDYRFDGALRNWYTALADIPSGPNGLEGANVQFLAQMTPTSISSTGEVGIVLGDRARGNFVLLGVRNNAGVYQIITEAFTAWASAGATVRAVTALATHWLHLLHPVAGSAFGPSSVWSMSAAWSVTSQLTGYTRYDGITLPARLNWAGFYIRSTAAGTPALTDIKFTSSILRCPYGDRSLRFYVYRDPAIPGSPDLLAAHRIVQALKQAHTDGTVITAKSLLCDDASGGCDRGPMGAI